MAEAFPLLPATGAFLGRHQTILTQAGPPVIATHRLIQALASHVSKRLVVLLQDTVAFRKPRYHLPFPATEMEELESMPLRS